MARRDGARVLYFTAQPQESPADRAHRVVTVKAQTMADDLPGGSASAAVLPMGSAYEIALFVLVDLITNRVRARRGESTRGDALAAHEPRVGPPPLVRPSESHRAPGRQEHLRARVRRRREAHLRDHLEAGVREQLGQLLRPPQVSGPFDRDAAVGLPAHDVLVPHVRADHRLAARNERPRRRRREPAAARARGRLNRDHQPRTPPREAGGTSRAVAEATSNRSPGCSRRACSIIRGDRSTPRTSRPRPGQVGSDVAGAAADVQNGPQWPRHLGERSERRPQPGLGRQVPEAAVDVGVGDAVVRGADGLEVGGLLHGAAQ